MSDGYNLYIILKISWDDVGIFFLNFIPLPFISPEWAKITKIFENFPFSVELKFLLFRNRGYRVIIYIVLQIRVSNA